MGQPVPITTTAPTMSDTARRLCRLPATNSTEPDSTPVACATAYAGCTPDSVRRHASIALTPSRPRGSQGEPSRSRLDDRIRHRHARPTTSPLRAERSSDWAAARESYAANPITRSVLGPSSVSCRRASPQGPRRRRPGDGGLHRQRPSLDHAGVGRSRLPLLPSCGTLGRAAETLCGYLGQVPRSCSAAAPRIRVVAVWSVATNRSLREQPATDTSV
jgi:hypothetical protein